MSIRPELWRETAYEAEADTSRNAQINHRIQQMYFTNPVDVYIPRTDGYVPSSWYDREVERPFEEDTVWEEDEEEEY